MAKKPKSAKKSRYGNPAKASADAAARSAERPSAEARLDRAMGALSKGYVDWLEAESRPNKSIDLSLAILDDFFDMYRILLPHPDPTNLVPAALREVMEVTAHANPLGAMTMRNGVHDYVAYLAEGQLWTGTHEDLMSILDDLAQSGIPAPAPDDDGLDYEELPIEDYEFAEIHLPAVSPEEAAEAAASSPLWKNTLALLAWIGDGRELTEDGTVPDREGAAATLTHTGIGKLAAAANFTTPQDHDAARLALYWEMISMAELVTATETHIRPTSKAPLGNDSTMLFHLRDLMGHFIFTATLEGSEEGIHEGWHLEMADWLTRAASLAPPESAPLIQALEEPDTVHPDLLAIAQNIATWAEEGLVTVGEFVEVPPFWRADVFDMLKDDFPVHASGPGAGQL